MPWEEEIAGGDEGGKGARVKMELDWVDGDGDGGGNGGGDVGGGRAVGTTTAGRKNITFDAFRVLLVALRTFVGMWADEGWVPSFEFLVVEEGDDEGGGGEGGWRGEFAFVF